MDAELRAAVRDRDWARYTILKQRLGTGTLCDQPDRHCDCRVLLTCPECGPSVVHGQRTRRCGNSIAGTVIAHDPVGRLDVCGPCGDYYASFSFWEWEVPR